MVGSDCLTGSLHSPNTEEQQQQLDIVHLIYSYSCQIVSVLVGDGK